MLGLLAIPPDSFPMVIFFIRMSDMSIDTLRVMFVIRGRKLLALILGFFQSSLWVVAISSVLSNLDNPWNIIGYASGFAAGNVVGMTIEQWLAIGHSNLRVISSRRGNLIAEIIRKSGYAVTEVPSRGKDGMVLMILCSVFRRDVNNIKREICDIDQDAFITVEDVYPLHRGFWRNRL